MSAHPIVLYVAPAAPDAEDGAAALEAADDGLVATPASDREEIRERAPAADCVVFAGTPTSTAGSILLEVLEACDGPGTPVVLYTEAAYAPAAARSTDGVEGYVRRDTADAVSHLADQVRWVCHDALDGPVVAEPVAGSATGDDELRSALAVAGELLADDAASGDAEPHDAVPDEAPSDDGTPVEPATIAVEFTVDELDVAACHFVRAGADRVETVAAAGDSPGDDGSVLEAPLDEAGLESVLDGERHATEPTDDGPATVAVPVRDDEALLAVGDGSRDRPFDDPTVETLADIGEVLGTALERRSVTRARRAELEELRADVDDLREERDRLDRRADRLETDRDALAELFHRLPLPAIRFVVDDELAIVADATDAYANAFEVDREAIRGRSLAAVLGDARGERSAGVGSVDDGEVETVVRRCETADGVREFAVTVRPPGDHESSGLVVYEDVTEATRNERELAAARNRLEEVEALVSEEMRRPLNVARGYLELAGETGDPDHVAEVDRAHERLREHVDQLDALTGREATPVETEPIALHDVARRAWVTVETGDARLQLGDDVVLEADRARLRELFERLLRAAIDGDRAGGVGGRDGDGGVPNGHADRDGPSADAADDAATIGAVTGGSSDEPPTVTVGATDDGFVVTGRADLVVDDGGEGIDAETLAGRTAAADGTGFRLGPVERIAEAHGWRVGVASGDEGTAFAFRGVDVSRVE